MICRLAVTFGFVAVLVLAFSALASPTLAAPASVPAPVLSPDPYYGHSDLISKAIPVTFCPCEQGYNCCGDQFGAPCGAPHQNCFCQGVYCVKGGPPPVKP